jgi:polysaccharide export outer membrane protein
VQNGDKIFIPHADAEVFYISGQVNKPGSYPVTEGMTFRKALAEGGGVSENGSEKKLKVIRDGVPMKRVKLEDPIKVGDIVTIGERLF